MRAGAAPHIQTAPRGRGGGTVTAARGAEAGPGRRANGRPPLPRGEPIAALLHTRGWRPIGGRGPLRRAGAWPAAEGGAVRERRRRRRGGGRQGRDGAATVASVPYATE